jgi:hypothetical protein
VFEVHTFVLEVHTLVFEVHTFVFEVHTLVFEVHTFVFCFTITKSASHNIEHKLVECLSYIWSHYKVRIQTFIGLSQVS